MALAALGTREAARQRQGSGKATTQWALLPYLSATTDILVSAINISQGYCPWRFPIPTIVEGTYCHTRRLTDGVEQGSRTTSVESRGDYRRR